ncbi:hypothetical protein BH10CHL1_BH10CHL1_22930 [soil metagenome]
MSPLDISYTNLYTRTEIQGMVGGELQTYLPQKNKCILAGCFSLELNPCAPNIIQVGKLPQVKAKAELLARQPENRFPVFVRESDQHLYSFQGYFKFRSITDNRSEIEVAERKSGRLGELSYVIYLQPD